MFAYSVIFSIHISRIFLKYILCHADQHFLRLISSFFACEEAKSYLFYSHIFRHINIHTDGYLLSHFGFVVIDMRMLVNSFIAFFLLATINFNAYAFKSYSQYQLWRLHPTNIEQVAVLRDFSHIAYQHNINFWSEQFHINTPVNFKFSHFSYYIFLSSN